MRTIRLSTVFPNTFEGRVVRNQIIKSGTSIGLAQITCPVKCLRSIMYYTYVLQSLKDMDFYTGFTKKLKQRFEQHKKDIVESTKNRRPFKLIYYEACISKEDVIRREKYLKTYHGKMYLRKRFKSYLTG